jgi:methyl-accepting chemotaxis protein
MNTDRKLGEVAANLDDMSDTIEELQDAAQEEGAKSRSATLDELKQDVEDASDAIDSIIDQRHGPEFGSGGECPEKGWT